MRIVAITGGSGFVGRHLVRRHVEAGDRVRLLSRRGTAVAGAESFRGDLAAGEVPTAFLDGAHVLYHCAGEIRDESLMERLHVTGTRALIEAASGRVGVWVQLSSVGVYGRRFEGCVTETDPLLPVGVYEQTKTESDLLVAASGLPFTILRPSTVFGNDMPNQSLRQFVSAIDRGHFFFIGPAGASANYIHVENVVDALQLCATPTGTAFNLSDHMTLEAFVETIGEVLGRRPPRLRLPVLPLRVAARIPGLPLTPSRIDALTSRVIYDSTKIEKRLGYRHRWTLKASIRDFVEHGR